MEAQSRIVSPTIAAIRIAVLSPTPRPLRRNDSCELVEVRSETTRVEAGAGAEAMTNQIARVRKLSSLLAASLDSYEKTPLRTDKVDCDAKLLCEALVELRIELGRNASTRTAVEPSSVGYSDQYITGYIDGVYATEARPMTQHEIDEIIIANLGESVRAFVERRP